MRSVVAGLLPFSFVVCSCLVLKTEKVGTPWRPMTKLLSLSIHSVGDGGWGMGVSCGGEVIWSVVSVSAGAVSAAGGV